MSSLHGRIRRLEQAARPIIRQRAFDKLVTAVKDGRLTIDQVDGRWPNLARQISIEVNENR